MLLAHKTVVVTGGNRGIGEAIVRATAGASVVIDYIDYIDDGRCARARSWPAASADGCGSAAAPSTCRRPG
jgi:NAD(P)-dependent dehydrogenase (short-subunit alcohol dehydrogenase family)